MGVMPDDIHLFVRTMADVPITMKDEITKILEANNWKETTIPDPTLASKNGPKDEGVNGGEKTMSCEPWQCAEIASTKKANPIQKPEIAVAMIKKASRPLLIVGSNANESVHGRQTSNRIHH